MSQLWQATETPGERRDAFFLRRTSNWNPLRDLISENQTPVNVHFTDCVICWQWRVFEQQACVTVDHTTVVVVILPLKHNMELVGGIFENHIPHLSIKAVSYF